MHICFRIMINESYYVKLLQIHETQILGKVGGGYKVAMATLNEGRVAIASQVEFNKNLILCYKFEFS